MNRIQGIKQGDMSVKCCKCDVPNLKKHMIVYGVKRERVEGVGSLIKYRYVCRYCSQPQEQERSAKERPRRTR